MDLNTENIRSHRNIWEFYGKPLRRWPGRRSREGDGGAIIPLGAGSLAGARGGMVNQIGGTDGGKAAEVFESECNSLSRNIIFPIQGYS